MRITRAGYTRPQRRGWLLRTACNICLASMFGMYYAAGTNAGWWT